MEITIKIKDNKSCQTLLGLLKKLNIETVVKETPSKKSKFKSSKEFRSLSGLWKDRDITIEQIREKGWPQRN